MSEVRGSRSQRAVQATGRTQDVVCCGIDSRLQRARARGRETGWENITVITGGCKCFGQICQIHLIIKTETKKQKKTSKCPKHEKQNLLAHIKE